MSRWLWLSVVLEAVTLGGTLYVYGNRDQLISDPAPVHWNFDWQADGYQPRDQVLPYLLIAPAGMGVMIILAVVLPWLSPKQFDVNRFRPTWEYVMGLVAALFAGVQGAILLASTGHPEVGLKLMLAGIMLFFVLIGNVLGKVRRNFWMGIRTPWTLASELVWNQTHRVAAWLYMAVGLVCLVAVLAGVNLIAVFVVFLLGVLFPIPYSLWLYKRLQREGRLESST